MFAGTRDLAQLDTIDNWKDAKWENDSPLTGDTSCEGSREPLFRFWPPLCIDRTASAVVIRYDTIQLCRRISQGIPVG